MRRQLASLMFAGLALSVPLVAASPDRMSEARETGAVPTPVAVQRVRLPATELRDEAAMVLIGTALIGLAAAVRRAA